MAINSPYIGTSLSKINAAKNIPKHTIHPSSPQTLFELIPPLFLTNIVLQSNLESFF